MEKRCLMRWLIWRVFILTTFDGINNMRNVQKISVFIIGFLMVGALSANNAGARAEEILHRVMAADGYLDKQLHQEFWKELGKIGSTESFNTAISKMRFHFLIAQEFQREGWRSALLSYRSSTVVKTKRMIEMEKEMVDHVKKIIPYPKGSYQYKEFLRGFNEQQSLAKKRTERLLWASAKNKTFKLPGREDFVLNEQSINFILNNINASFKRIKNLLNKDWNGTP